MLRLLLAPSHPNWGWIMKFFFEIIMFFFTKYNQIYRFMAESSQSLEFFLLVFAIKQWIWLSELSIDSISKKHQDSTPDSTHGNWMLKMEVKAKRITEICIHNQVKSFDWCLKFNIYFHVIFFLFVQSTNESISLLRKKFSSAFIEFYDTRNAVSAHISSELENRVDGTFEEFLSCARTVCRGQ